MPGPPLSLDRTSILPSKLKRPQAVLVNGVSATVGLMLTSAISDLNGALVHPNPGCPTAFFVATTQNDPGPIVANVVLSRNSPPLVAVLSPCAEKTLVAIVMSLNQSKA